MGYFVIVGIMANSSISDGAMHCLETFVPVPPSDIESKLTLHILFSYQFLLLGAGWSA